MTSLLTRLRSGWLLPAILARRPVQSMLSAFSPSGTVYRPHHRQRGNRGRALRHRWFQPGRAHPGGAVFMAVLALVTLASGAIARAGSPALRPLLLLQAVLLAGFLGLGVGFGRFPDADSPMAVLAGMFGVAAMAARNAGKGVALRTLALYHRGNDDEHHATDCRPPGDARPSRARSRRTRQGATPGTHDLPVRDRVHRRLCRRGRPGSQVRPLGASAAGRPQRARSSARPS